MEKNRTLRRLKMLFTTKRMKRRHDASDTRRDKLLETIEGFGKPSVLHATMVIFVEFFAWGLMTTPTINALKEAFPTGTFLKNGIIQGIKGILSFLSAPLIGALSDVWGRKSFLLLSVFFTCLPIPFLFIDSRLYFIGIALSGAFAVTFSIAFAYVADCTAEHERSYSYGLISATFAASLVISPALGTWICTFTGGLNQVVLLASLISLFNLAFIVYIVPESLPESSRKSSWGSAISWEQADPFASLQKVSGDPRLLLFSIIVFLSYLPEAGQYSCFFLYLRQVIGFSLSQVSAFIAILCISSVIAQTFVLALLMKWCGHKYTIIVGLILQAVQLFIYGIWTTKWLMWVAGILASASSIIYPAISALVSKNADSDQQGVVLGILTGVRGLCNGLGPALYGVLFYLSDVHLEGYDSTSVSVTEALKPHLHNATATTSNIHVPGLYRGVPFLFGVLPVLLALCASFFITDKGPLLRKKPSLSSLSSTNTVTRGHHDNNMDHSLLLATSPS